MLVVGEKPGASKLKKAEELDIKVIDERKFLEMVGEDYDDYTDDGV